MIKIFYSTILYAFIGVLVFGSFAINAQTTIDKLINVPYWSDVTAENDLITTAERDYLGYLSSGNKEDIGATQLYNKSVQFANRIESDILKIAKSDASFLQKRDDIIALTNGLYNESYNPSAPYPNNIKGLINSLEEIVQSWVTSSNPNVDPIRLQQAYEYFRSESNAYSLAYVAGNFPQITEIKDRLTELITNLTANDLVPQITDPGIVPPATPPVLIPEFTLLGRNLHMLLTTQKSQITGKSFSDWINPDPLPLNSTLLDVTTDFKNIAAMRYKLILEKYYVKKQAQANLALKLHKEVSDIAGTISASPYDMQTIAVTLRAKFNTVNELVVVTNYSENGFDGWQTITTGIEPMNIAGWDSSIVESRIATMESLVNEYLQTYRLYPNLSHPQTEAAWQAARAATIEARDMLLKSLNQVQNIASGRLAEVKSKIDELENSIKSEKETQSGLNTMWTDINNTMVALVSWVMGIFSRSLNIGIEQISKNTYLKEIHSFTRDIANMFFILLLVVAGLCTAFEINIQQYTIKNLLPRFIQATFLVNISLLLCQLITDFSLIISNVLLEKAGEISDIGYAFATTGTNIYGISGAAPALLFGDILTSPQTQILGGVFDNTLASVIILLFVFLLTMAVDIFLIVRAAGIWFLVALSPIVFMLWFLPSLKNIFKLWWTNLLRFVFMGPLVALIFLIGVSFSQISLADNFLKILIGLATFGLILTVPSMTGLISEGFQKISDSLSPFIQNYFPALTHMFPPSSIAGSLPQQEKSAEENITTEEEKTRTQFQMMQLAQTPDFDLKKVWLETQKNVSQKAKKLFKNSSKTDPTTSLLQQPLVAISQRTTAHNQPSIILDTKNLEEVQSLLAKETTPQFSQETTKALTKLSLPALEKLFNQISPDFQDKILNSLNQKDKKNTDIWPPIAKKFATLVAGRNYVQTLQPPSETNILPRSIDHFHTATEFEKAVLQHTRLEKENIADILFRQTPLKELSLDTIQKSYEQGTKETKDFLLSTLNSPLQHKLWSDEQVELLTWLAGTDRIQEAKRAISQKLAQDSGDNQPPSWLLEQKNVSSFSTPQTTTQSPLHFLIPNLSNDAKKTFQALGQEIIRFLPSNHTPTEVLLPSLANPDFNQIPTIAEWLHTLSLDDQEKVLSLTYKQNQDGNPFFKENQQQELELFAGQQYAQAQQFPILPSLPLALANTIKWSKPLQLPEQDIKNLYSSSQNPHQRNILLHLAQTDLLSSQNQKTVKKLLDLEIQQRAKNAEKEMGKISFDLNITPYTLDTLQTAIENKDPISTEKLLQTIQTGTNLKHLPMTDVQMLYDSADSEQREIILGSTKKSGMWTQTQKDSIQNNVKQDEMNQANQTSKPYVDSLQLAKNLPSMFQTPEGLEAIQNKLKNPLALPSNLTAFSDPTLLRSMQQAFESPDTKHQAYGVLDTLVDTLDQLSQIQPNYELLQQLSENIVDEFAHILPEIGNQKAAANLENYVKTFSDKTPRESKKTVMSTLPTSSDDMNKNMASEEANQNDTPPMQPAAQSILGAVEKASKQNTVLSNEKRGKPEWDQKELTPTTVEEKKTLYRRAAESEHPAINQTIEYAHKVSPTKKEKIREKTMILKP